jgi:hypothetical protein
VRLGLGFLLLLLVLPLAVIHDAANGRARVGGDLDQVQPGLTGHGQSLVGLHHAHLFVLFVDQADGAQSNSLVDPQALAAVVFALNETSSGDGVGLLMNSP